jgi:hypothetical protein
MRGTISFVVSRILIAKLAIWFMPGTDGKGAGLGYLLMPLAKRLVAIVVFLVLLGLGWATYRIGVVLMWWNPAVRPPNVSKRAHYVFLWEEAEWFDCSVDSARNVNVCQAWDARGDLLASGDFRLEDENRAATHDELHPSIVGPSDRRGQSNTIYLFGPNGKIFGRQLVRVSGPNSSNGENANYSR